MKKLLNIFRFEIGISFIPFLIIILLSGQYKLFFTYFLITFIHELGHVIMALGFKVKVNKIKLSMFGFNADIDNMDYLAIYKQMLIIIMGPLTYFGSVLLIKELYLNEVISLIMYYKALATNKYILFFNLLPIYPLDGGRLIKVVFDKVFTFKFSKFFLYSVSFIFIVGFALYTVECKQYLMYLFLLINFVLNVCSIKKEWKAFLIRRYYLNNKYKEKIHKKKDLYMYRNNFIIRNKDILTEKEIILDLLRD